MQDVLKDLSVITTVPKVALDELIDKEILCICHNICECKDEDSIEVDIGLGTLCLKKTDDNIKFRFTPNLKFANAVKSSVNTGCSPLISMVESTLKDRLENTYKDLL